MRKTAAFIWSLVIMMLGLWGTGHAGSVKGDIRCTSGASSEGVFVYVPGDSFISLTDEHGGFLIRDMPSGRYMVKVKKGEKVVSAIKGVKVKGSGMTDLGAFMVNCEGVCTENSDCASFEFCVKAAGDCGGRGVCHERPTVCATPYPVPVCGCDGKDYADGCEAARLGVNVAHRGHCK